MRFRPATLTLLALAALPAAGQELRLRIDPRASTASFELGATLHTVHGTLRVGPAEITVDPATRKLEGNIVVDAATATTDNAKRDRKMHAEVLESSRFPEIVFAPRSFEGELRATGESRLDLSGTLELHGSDRPLRVPVVVRIDGDRIVARAEFPVPYVAWGLTDPSTFLLRVAKTVDVTVEIVGQRISGP